jgi:hypothetical protein
MEPGGFKCDGSDFGAFMKTLVKMCITQYLVPLSNLSRKPKGSDTICRRNESLVQVQVRRPPSPHSIQVLFDLAIRVVSAVRDCPSGEPQAASYAVS